MKNKQLAFYVAFVMLVEVIDAQTEISMLPDTDSIYVTSGSNVSVVCMASGLSGKLVVWYHAGKLIANVSPTTVLYADPAHQEKYKIGLADLDGGNFTLTLLGFSVEDDVGTIECSVSGVDPLSIELKSLVIPDEVRITMNSAHREQVLNDTHSSVVISNLTYLPSISCYVTNSRPAASITWSWNGNETAASLLNITDVKQASGDLHNVTSTIFVPSHFLYLKGYEGPNFVEDEPHYNESEKENVTIEEEEIENITDIDWPILEENFSDNDVSNEELSRSAMDQSMASGVVSCKAAVGDRIFVKSLIIDLTASGNSGTRNMQTFWPALMTSVAVFWSWVTVNR